MKRRLTALALALAIALAISPGALARHKDDFDYAKYEDIGLCVLEANSGEILLAHNEHERYAPASLAKLLTVLTVLEYLKPGETITITTAMLDLVEKDSSLARIKAGERLTVEQLIYGMLLASGNDAARAVSVICGRIILKDDDASARMAMNAFVGRMNEKALELGMKNSHFLNPDGYPVEGMYSTAYDIARLSVAVKRDPFLSAIAATPAITIQTNMATHAWRSTNRLVLETLLDASNSPIPNPSYDPRVDGLKTGTGDYADGRMLAYSVSQDGMDVIGVLLHVREEKGLGLYVAGKETIDYVFARFSLVRLIGDEKEKNSITITNSTMFLPKKWDLYAASTGMVCIPKESVGEVTFAIAPVSGTSQKSSGGFKLLKSVNAGEPVVYISFSSNSREIARIALISTRPIRKAGLLDALAIALMVLAIAFVAFAILAARRLGIKVRFARRKRKSVQ